MQQPSPSSTITRSNALSRTSSAASISSDDISRRTRKRFTSVQLVMLEQLFHLTSHPTREQREAVAQATGMEMKSVTIWFQNKRQTERKVALHHATSQSNLEGHGPTPFPDRGPVTPHPSISSHTSRPTHARTMSTSSLHTPRRKITPPRPRPSLDRVAARTESRLPPPRTPTKPRDPHASPWDNMPSSPLAPPVSPPAHDFIDFVGHGRTLEWACEAARLAEKGHTRISSSKSAYHGIGCSDAGDETEEENAEPITPEGSFGSDHIMSRPWKLADTHSQTSLRKPGLASELQASESERKDVGRDDDMMRAALVLCGLGRKL